MKKQMVKVVQFLLLGLLVLLSGIESHAENRQGISYVYVDETMLNLPGTQSIVVGFEDETLHPQQAVLRYHSLLTGKSYEMNSSAVTDGAVLFVQDYSYGEQEDEYLLDCIV